MASARALLRGGGVGPHGGHLEGVRLDEALPVGGEALPRGAQLDELPAGLVELAVGAVEGHAPLAHGAVGLHHHLGGALTVTAGAVEGAREVLALALDGPEGAVAGAQAAFELGALAAQAVGGLLRVFELLRVALLVALEVENLLVFAHQGLAQESQALGDPLGAEGALLDLAARPRGGLDLAAEAGVLARELVALARHVLRGREGRAEVFFGDERRQVVVRFEWGEFHGLSVSSVASADSGRGGARSTFVHRRRRS